MAHDRMSHYAPLYALIIVAVFAATIIAAIVTLVKVLS